MRMEVEKVICDRCGREISGETFISNKYSIITDVGDEGEHLTFRYHELCRRCARTVLRRLEEAGPLKGAPKAVGDAT